MARSLHRAGTQRFGSGGSLLLSAADDDESTSGEPRVVSESVDRAVETCAARLAKLPEIMFLVAFPSVSTSNLLVRTHLGR